MYSSRYMPLVDWSFIEASAPGSFVLVGEYADLYDKNAIAVTIDKRIKVTIRSYREGRLKLNLLNYNDVREWPTTSLSMTRLVGKYNDIFEYSDLMPLKLIHLLNERYRIQPIEADFCDQSNVEDDDEARKHAEKSIIAFIMLYVALGDSYAWSARPALDVDVESDIPPGRGYGSSSAYGVAVCAALMKVFRISAEPAVINHWAINVDKYFHGKVSGLHTSASIHGGYIYFQNSKMKYPGIPQLTRLKALFIDTAVRRRNQSIIKLLEVQQKESSDNLQTILEHISDLVVMTWRKLNDAHFSPKSIASYLRACQERLDTLGLGNETVSEICSHADSLQLAAKQTKSGQAVFLLYEESDCRGIEEFKSILTNLGYKHESLDICCEGLEVKTYTNQSTESDYTKLD